MGRGCVDKDEDEGQVQCKPSSLSHKGATQHVLLACMVLCSCVGTKPAMPGCFEWYICGMWHKEQARPQNAVGPKRDWSW